MRLTRQRAYTESLRLWEFLAETGKQKEAWDGWGDWGSITGLCFFCEYDERHQQEENCQTCPLEGKYGGCYKTHYADWYLAGPKNKGEYAKLFLEQLRELEVK